MVYISNTLTDANPAATLYTTIATALGTAGFTLVDTVVIAPRTHKIHKSAAANNSFGQDWYLDVAYTTAGAGALYFTAFEYYDPATDLGYRGPSAYASAGGTTNADGSRYGATGQTLENIQWEPRAAGSNANNAFNCPTTSFAYWISITGDRIIALESQDPSRVQYAGLYDLDSLYSAKVGANVFPLGTGHLQASGSAQSSGSGGGFGLTRWIPSHAYGSSQWYYMGQLFPDSGQIQQQLPRIPTGDIGQYPFGVVKVMISWDTSYTASSANPVGRFGWLKDVALTRVDATVARGDTITIGTDTWVLGTPIGNGVFAMKAI